ncbi:MAG: zinc ribbon domain-containing protein [Anaerolineales bacterium]|nr:zinc ribbon domain-containing protein [Anaerolineales bacterium]
MPIYEYRCRECNNNFEALVRGKEAVTCPQCGSLSLNKLFSKSYVSTGRTTRKAGQTCCGREERCSAPPCSSGDGCRRD